MLALGMLWLPDSIHPLVYYAVAAIPVGRKILVEAIKSWAKTKFANEFTLMLLACVGAFFIGEYPEAVAILLFYSFGEKLEESASDKARGRISAMLNRMPKTVTVEHADGSQTLTEPETVEPESLLVVKPGERVAIDGILNGTDDAEFDTSAITGESLPAAIRPGESVKSGSIPIDREVRILTSCRFADSSMSRIMKMIEEAASKKSPTETLLRKITRWYTPAVIAATAMLFAVPLLISLANPTFTFDWQLWFRRSLVLLVCSCPCALVVSIPLSYFAAIGNASARGFLFKGSRYLDRLRDVDTLLLDKTGTLTTGEFRVTGIATAMPEVSPEHVLAVAAALDRHSNHPLASAIVREADRRGAATITAESVTTVAHGLSGVIGNQYALVGSRKLMATNGISINADETPSSEVCVASGGRYLGSILLDDTLKPGIADTLAGLHDLGVKTIEIISGDRAGAVAKVATAAGADGYRPQLLPDDKHRIVESLKRQGHTVAFVGDGINDAPSLAAADVGIAIGSGGTDVAIESADAVITGSNLNRLVDAFRISRKIKRVVFVNTSLAIGVKALVMVLGAAGYASLWAAVFADTGITLLTVTMTLIKFRFICQNFVTLPNMKQPESSRRLSDAGIRPSPVRTLIMRALGQSSRPMSSQEIETELETVDRSSISRALALFTEKGVVHCVDDGSGSMKYEVCRSSDCHESDNDLHPHFHCINCGATFCFDGIRIPSINLPEGFTPVSVNHVVKGICPECSRREQNKH